MSEVKFYPVSEDTVHVSVWLDFSNPDEFFSHLEEVRLEAESIEAGLADDLADESYHLCGQEVDDVGMICINRCMWKMRPHGAGGSKYGSRYYKYVMQYGGVVIKIDDVRRYKNKPSGDLPDMVVEFGSIPLAECGGLSAAWDYFLKNILSDLPVVYKRNMLSRVDMYTDISGINVSEFQIRFAAGKKITRGRNSEDYGLDYTMHNCGERKTGFSVGSGIKLRVYDKIKEMEVKDTWGIKQSVFSSKYGGLPDILTRVEYQLRRKYIKDFLIDDQHRIDTVEDYECHKEGLWLYLTKSWFRLTEEVPSKTVRHNELVETWSVWEQVQKAVGVKVNSVKRVARNKEAAIDKYIKQAFGCAQTATYLDGEDASDINVVCRIFNKHVVRLIDRAKVKEKVVKLKDVYRRNYAPIVVSG